MCSKMKEDGCKNATAMVKSIPGAKVDACDIKCCYNDNCNTKDLVVLTKPTKKPPKALAAHTGVSVVITLVMSLLAGVAVTAY